MKLYSYCLRIDDGAAPNPYWNVCTLVICKPAIRRMAEVGDWIVGHGSVNAPGLGDASDKVVYAMRVTQKMTMREYDEYCLRKLQKKIPDWNSTDFRRRVGDCIYDFRSRGLPRIRLGVHSAANRSTDLSGKHALLSSHFYYFGDQPIAFPKALLPIVHRARGHKSHLNDEFADEFEEWIDGLGIPPKSLLGNPQWKLSPQNSCKLPEKCARDA